MKDTLVIGFGSEILADENIIPMVCAELKKEFTNVDFLDNPLLSIDLLPKIENYQALIFIDTIFTNEKKPGEVHFFSPKDYLPTIHLENYHDISLKTFFELGTHLGFNITRNIHVIAVEIVENLNISRKITSQLDRQRELIIEKIIRFLIVNQYVKSSRTRYLSDT